MKIIDYIVSIICYIFSFLLIIYYLLLEISVLDVASPLKRIFIIMIIIFLMYIGSLFIYKHNKSIGVEFVKYNNIIWFILYITMLLNLTLFDKYFDRNAFSLYTLERNQINRYFELNFNIVPFKTIYNYIIAFKNNNLLLEDFFYNIFGNLIAFGPFAYFLPRIFKKIDELFKYVFIVSFVIIIIETLQMVMMCGSFDIDDYILNIVGSVLFYYIFNRSFIKKYIDYFNCFQYKKKLV